MEQSNIDRAKCLSTFSEEIWQKIFRNLEDDKDLKTCSNASPYFEDLLKLPWNGILLQQVLQILNRTGYLTSKDSQSILKWRLISHEWKNAINNLLETRPYHSQCKMTIKNVFDYSKENESDIAHPTYFRLYRFTLEELEDQIIPMVDRYYFKFQFLPTMDRYCPSPSRHLEIMESTIINEQLSFDSDYSTDLELYSRETEHFLHLAGHTFWHVTIEFRIGTLMERYLKLKRYLEKMPNLKSLYISEQCRPSNDDKFEKKISKKALALPTLEKLELLSVCGTKGVINRQLILAAPNAKIIDLRRRLRGDFYPFIDLLSNRQQLNIESVFGTGVHDLANLCGVEVLRVKLDLIPYGSIMCSSLFKALENCKDTLLELTLSLDGMQEGLKFWRFTKTPLNLGKLKIFDFSTRSYCSLDFLLGMQNLECLYLRFGERRSPSFDMEDEDKVEKINFNDCFKTNFMKCNIWELIPCLKVVHLNSGVWEGTANKYKRDRVSSVWHDSQRFFRPRSDLCDNY